MFVCTYVCVFLVKMLKININKLTNTMYCRIKREKQKRKKKTRRPVLFYIFLWFSPAFRPYD